MVTVWLKGESEASTVCFTAIGGTWEVGYSNFHSSCVWSVGLVCFCRHSCFAGLSRVVLSVEIRQSECTDNFHCIAFQIFGPV